MTAPTNKASRATRLFQSAMRHLRVALIAVIFGLTAYGLMHVLIWIIAFFEP